MVSGGFDTNIVAPKVIIVPTSTPLTNISGATAGQLYMSGAKLYVSTGNKFELITST